MASFDKVLTKVFGSSNERFLKSIRPTIERINEFEPSLQKLSDDKLRAKTIEFKERVADAHAVKVPTKSSSGKLAVTFHLKASLNSLKVRVSPLSPSCLSRR